MELKTLATSGDTTQLASSASTAALADHTFDCHSEAELPTVIKAVVATTGGVNGVYSRQCPVSLPSTSLPPDDATAAAASDAATECRHYTNGHIESNSTTVDRWNIADDTAGNTGVKWTDLSQVQKLVSVLWIIARLCLVVILLYLFVCSLDVLQDSFQLLGGRAAGNVFAPSLINNPVCGLMIGVLVTVLVQSSSTSTSIVVSMVGSGLLEVRQAIPIIMGANIGTTVTNTLVALTQSADRDVFRRAFAGASVHDMFNWLTVCILLPLEVASGYLYHMTSAMTRNIISLASDSTTNSADNPQFLKVITVPLTKLIIEVDKHVITAIAEQTDRRKFPLVKYYCKEIKENLAFNFTDGEVNQTAVDSVDSEIFTWNINYTTETLSWQQVVDSKSTKCSHVFVGCGLPGSVLNEPAVGAILLATSLASMILCLVALVKVLNSLLRGSMASVVRRSVNADFPGYASCLTGYVALLIGAVVTVLVQSSSVFTSALTPLVGIGVVSVERVFPLTLGSNIGTTVTGLLAAFTADQAMVRYTLQIALCHLFFNISGILIFYPIPLLRRVPIGLAKHIGDITATYRWFAVFYLVVLYVLLPLSVFLLSLAGWYVLLAVGLPLLLVFLAVVVINILQSRRPHWLPTKLHSWHFLPHPLRSLAPYDHVITVCFRSDVIQHCHQVCRCVKAINRNVAVNNSAPPGGEHVNVTFTDEYECSRI